MKNVFIFLLLCAAALAPVYSAQLTLRWADNSANEKGFTVERAPDVAGAPGEFAPVANLAANATSYIDATLAESTRYHYRVRAFNDAGASAYTNTASAVTFGPAPAAPGDAQAFPPPAYTPPEPVVTLAPGGSLRVVASSP